MAFSIGGVGGGLNFNSLLSMDAGIMGQDGALPGATSGMNLQQIIQLAMNDDASSEAQAVAGSGGLQSFFNGGGSSGGSGGIGSLLSGGLSGLMGGGGSGGGGGLLGGVTSMLGGLF